MRHPHINVSVVHAQFGFARMEPVMEPAEIIVHLGSNCAWLASQAAASDG